MRVKKAVNTEVIEKNALYLRHNKLEVAQFRSVCPCLKNPTRLLSDFSNYGVEFLCPDKKVVVRIFSHVDSYFCEPLEKSL